MDIQIQSIQWSQLPLENDLDYYKIFFTELGMTYSVDQVNYRAPAFSAIFLAPHQHFLVIANPDKRLELTQVLFNGDYYCIELHKHDVACNGLLFNTVYQLPHVELSASVFEELLQLCQKMILIMSRESKFSNAILKSYLQLILALTSDEKQKYIDQHSYFKQLTNIDGIIFQELVEQNYKVEKSISFYASAMNMTAGALSKRIKKTLQKSPSKIIQERTILEAKKLLHLTYKSIKEIANELYFEDQHYFSRYFKNTVGISPLRYREQVGISEVANLSQ
ncbi:helix-turn-helix domain-containing protein [Sphingobacterium sp. JB170]|uniref:AraC family transcriptional regulator n=1 Tax=Sphingobacterium sp. JB170 TaxID=1434842 RepID=UPI00097F520B|nr:helix-turn-helix domain-containing protein [Sphingobacterium sp. JB170]SJN42101.1 Transcriptional regulator, AraC family [Sphingobacterium sp. JB170]